MGGGKTEVGDGIVVVVDSSTDVVVVTTAFDVVVDSARVVVGSTVVAAVTVVGVAVASSAVEDSVRVGPDVVEGAVGFASTICEKPTACSSAVADSTSEVSIPPDCRGWQAESAATQANEAKTDFLTSFLAMSNIRIWQHISPLWESKKSELALIRCCLRGLSRPQRHE